MAHSGNRVCRALISAARWYSAPALSSCNTGEIAEAVNGHARQPVGFTGNQTIAVQPVTFCQPLAPLLRLLQTTDKEVDIDGFFFIERPDARADLRCRRVCAAC